MVASRKVKNSEENRRRGRRAKENKAALSEFEMICFFSLERSGAVTGSKKIKIISLTLHLLPSLRRQRHRHLLPPLLPRADTPHDLELDLERFRRRRVGRRRRRRRRRGGADSFKSRSEIPRACRRPPADGDDHVPGRDSRQRPPHGQQTRPVRPRPRDHGGDHHARWDGSVVPPPSSGR